MSNISIVDVNPSNISEHPAKCFLNPKHEGYVIKSEWLKKRFSEGLKIKNLYVEGEKKCVGFIEYVSGEYVWRAVTANDYLFIHCIWISPNKYKNKGYASILINEVIKDAEKQGKNGVAVITSEGPFMAGKSVFLKNEFESIENVRPSYELLIKKLKEGPNPKINDWEKQLEKYQGLNIIYTNQCPWVARSINEIGEVIKKEGLKINFIELKTAKEAQNAPSVYATFNLIYNGKILADHYISTTRFNNIIKKELK